MSLRAILILGFIISFFLLTGETQLWSQEKAGPANLIAIWGGQKDQITTAQIKYRAYRTAGGLGVRSRKDVLKLIASAKLDADPNNLEKIINGLAAKPLGKNPWSTMESWFEGPRVREDEMVGRNLEVQVRDGVNQVEYSAVNRTAQIMASGIARQYIRSLRDFRLVPSLDKLPPIIARDGAKITFGDDSFRLIVDFSNGAIYQYTEVASGQVRREVIQDSFVSYPDQILFPSFVVEAEYKNDEQLGWISLSLVESAIFNQELSPEVFAIAVPAGTNVIDQRQPGIIHTLKVRSAITNVVQLADADLDIPNGGRSLPLWLLFTGAFFLIVFISLAWYRRRQKLV